MHILECFGALAAAALLFWLASFVFQSPRFPGVLPDERGPQFVPSAVVATVEGSVDASLFSVRQAPGANGGAKEASQLLSIAAASGLLAGRYRLDSGVIALKFSSGANVILESPATIDLTSAKRVRLEQGRLVGKVPPEAIGFTVETPTATVVDLGTEFGVAASGDGDADVSVFDGEVEVVAATSVARSGEEAKGGFPLPLQRRLRDGESAHADAVGLGDSVEVIANLYWRVVPTHKELEERRAYERWLNFGRKLTAKGDVVAYYPFNGHQPGDQVVRNASGEGRALDSEVLGAKWEQGRWVDKQAVRFVADSGAQEAGGSVRLSLPGEYDVLTLAAWVHVDALREGKASLLVTETWDQPGPLHWQLMQSGQLHVGIESDAIEKRVFSDSVGVVGLHRWSHVAVVIDRQKSQIEFFIDGVSAGLKQVEIPQGLILGATALGNWKPEVSHEEYASCQALEGKVDELVVVKGAMGEQDIHDLYEVGNPQLQ